jgi:hypothetical protein
MAAAIARALISVSDKTGLVEFARGLHALGVEILSTGGTASALTAAGIPVVSVSDFTGSPEILDGRVKTLHPKIHGGLLARRDDAKHREQMQANEIRPIDLVVVNLYPFEATVAKPNCSLEDAIENIDIGGPSMIRSAAKNHHDVAVGHRDRLIDAEVVRVDALHGEARGLGEAVVVGFLELRFTRRAADIVFVRRITRPVAARRDYFGYQKAFSRLRLRENVAHVARVAAGSARFLTDLRWRNDAGRQPALGRRPSDCQFAVGFRLHGPGRLRRNVCGPRATVEGTGAFTQDPKNFSAGRYRGAARHDDEARFAALRVAHRTLAGLEVQDFKSDVAPPGALGCDPMHDAGRGHCGRLDQQS